MRYDIIGDVHGHADALTRLLEKLGYANKNGSWKQSGSKAVFLGDYIDRGPDQLKTINIVRRMVDNGDALAIMGNHEFNAIAYYTRDPENGNDFLRKHSEKNNHQHSKFLEAVGGDSGKYKELIDWFLTLPLWIDLPAGIRFVHATWHQGYMDYLSGRLNYDNTIPCELLVSAARKPDDESSKYEAEPTIYKAVEAILKGLEVPIPGGLTFNDKDGHTRKEMRLQWWDEHARDYRSASDIRDEDFRLMIPETPLPDHMILDTGGKPIFFGHYWMTGVPGLLNPIRTCLDFSVAKQGSLAAYRWDGEKELQEDHLAWVSSK